MKNTALRKRLEEHLLICRFSFLSFFLSFPIVVHLVCNLYDATPVCIIVRTK